MPSKIKIARDAIDAAIGELYVLKIAVNSHDPYSELASRVGWIEKSLKRAAKDIERSYVP